MSLSRGSRLLLLFFFFFFFFFFSKVCSSVFLRVCVLSIVRLLSLGRELYAVLIL